MPDDTNDDTAGVIDAAAWVARIAEQLDTNALLYEQYAAASNAETRAYWSGRTDATGHAADLLRDLLADV